MEERKSKGAIQSNTFILVAWGMEVLRNSNVVDLINNNMILSQCCILE